MTPRRTCVGCRTTSEITALRRVALLDDGTLVVDRNAPGRGAWLCRIAGSEDLHPSCLELAWRRQGFHRAFRRPVEAQPVTALHGKPGEDETMHPAP